MAIYSYLLLAFLAVHVLTRGYRQGRLISCLFSAAALISVAALRDTTVGTDLPTYLERFDIVASSGWRELPRLVHEVDFELGYLIFCKAISWVSSSHRFFIAVTSTLIVAGWEYLFYRESDSIWLSNWIFITLNIFFGTMNILRQSMAAVLIYLSLHYLRENKNGSYVIRVLIASTLHFPALIWLALLAAKRVRLHAVHLMFYGVGVLAGSQLLYLSMVRLLTDTKYEIYLNYLGQGTGYVKIIEILIVLALAGLYVKVREADFTIYLYVLLLALVVNVFAFRMSIAGRTLDYFFPSAAIVLPDTLNGIRNKRNQALLLCFLLLLMALRFLRYCYVDLNGAVPYRFFFLQGG